MSEGFQPARRVSLLTTSLAKINEENTRSNTVTPTLSTTSTHSTIQQSGNSTNYAIRPTNDGFTEQVPLFNPGFNFEFVPDATMETSPWTAGSAKDIASITSHSPSTLSTPSGSLRTRPNTANLSLPTADQLPIFGDEIIPMSGSSTPNQSSSPAVLSPLETPIKYDSYTARLRKGHTLLKLQDSSKVLKFLDSNKSKQKLHRALSETETNKFDPVYGRRVVEKDEVKYIPTKLNPYDLTQVAALKNQDPTAWSFSTYDHHLQDKQKDAEKKYAHLDLGLNDEYLPDLDFAQTLRQWDSLNHQFVNNDPSLYSSQPSSADVSLSSTPMGPSHSQVQPVSVPQSKRTLEEEEEWARSLLPEDFNSMKMSERRKVLKDLSLRADPEILKKFEKEASRSRSRLSLASQFLTPSFSSRSLRSYDEGSVVLGQSLGRTIGSGAWGLIRECHEVNAPGEAKAMKIIRTQHESVRIHFRREVNIWRQLQHPNILPLIAVKDTPEAIFCLMPKIDGGNLYDLASKWGLYSSTDPQTPRYKRLRITRAYLLQVIKALMYMHSKGIVHGDVKLENCLIHVRLPKTRILLCDFGMSHQFKVMPDNEETVKVKDSVIKRRPSIPRSFSGQDVRGLRSLLKIVSDKNLVHDDTKVELGMSPSADSSESDVLSFDATPIEPKAKPMINPALQLDPTIPDSHIGSLPYAAPELLEVKPPPLGPSADIWAFGVLLYTMCTGKLPFPHDYEPRIRAGIQSGKYDVDAFVEACDGNENFIMAMKGCMERDITKRFTFEQVYELLDKSNLV